MRGGAAVARRAFGGKILDSPPPPAGSRQRREILAPQQNFMYFVYILQSLSTGKYYIGYTSNLVNRLKQHQKGKTKSTKNRGPYKIVYKEKFLTKEKAYKRERQIKKFKGGEAFKRLI